MKKHDLYFGIKKNLFFSILNFHYKSFNALSRWVDKLHLNKKINTLKDLKKLISETLNLSFFF